MFKSEQAALYYHNYGRGRKLEVDGNIWVNADLTRTEREAMFKKREERRKRLEKEKNTSASVPVEEPSSPVTSRRGSASSASQEPAPARGVSPVLPESGDNVMNNTRDSLSN